MFAAFLRARLKSLGGTQFRDAHLRAAAALQKRADRLGAMRHAMAVGDMPLAAAVLADSMHTILEFTNAQEARAVARAWLAKFGDAAAEANPGQLLEFVLPLASAGQREAERWLTKVNRAHPSLPPGLDALAHGTRLLQARLHVLRREWAKAGEILEETEPLTIRERVERGILRSLAAQAADLSRAHRYLRTALELAQPHGYLATIIEGSGRQSARRCEATCPPTTKRSSSTAALRKPAQLPPALGLIPGSRPSVR